MADSIGHYFAPPRLRGRAYEGQLPIAPTWGVISVILALLIVSAMIFFLARTKYSGFAKRQFQNQIDSSPGLQETKTITLDSEGIKGRQGLGFGETSWDGVIEATETPDDFYFFTAKRFAMFVPKSAFSSSGQQEELRALLRLVLGDRANNLK